MTGSEPCAPRVGDRMANLLAEDDQVRVRHGDDLLLLLQMLTVWPVHPNDKFDVNGVGVADGDTGLQPAVFCLPSASERVGASLEATKLIEHKSQGSKT